MTTIFECESGVGKCTCENNQRELRYAEPEYARIYARTVATLNGHRGMLKIEHHCYLRQGAKLPEQRWIKPTVLLEPALGSREELAAVAQRTHEKFVERVRSEFPEEYLV